MSYFSSRQRLMANRMMANRVSGVRPLRPRRQVLKIDKTLNPRRTNRYGKNNRRNKAQKAVKKLAVEAFHEIPPHKWNRADFLGGANGLATPALTQANSMFYTWCLSPRMTTGTASTEVLTPELYISSLKYYCTLTAHQSNTSRSQQFHQPLLIRWAIVHTRSGESILSTAPTRIQVYGDGSAIFDNNLFRNWSKQLNNIGAEVVANEASNFIFDKVGHFYLSPARNGVVGDSILNTGAINDNFLAPAGVLGVQIEREFSTSLSSAHHQKSLVIRAPYKKDHHMSWPTGTNTLTGDAKGRGPLYYVVFAAENIVATDLVVSFNVSSLCGFRDV